MVYWCREDGDGKCWAADGEAIRKLTRAVLAGKRFLGGGDGGSFQINEFGQVLVPSPKGDGRCALVGEITGRMLLCNPFEDEGSIDLADASGLECGDPWPKPYVGIPHNLSGRSQIYFYRMYEGGGRSEYPTCQDRELIEALRSIRRSGAIRFIVNPYGLVIMKTPPQGRWMPEEKWEPVFVGRINHRRWFKKES